MANKHSLPSPRRRKEQSGVNSTSPPNEIGDLNSQVLDRRIKQAIDLIAKKTAVGSPIQVSQIAIALHLSPSHLRHLFRREVGTSPTRYGKTIRLQKARDLLETSFLSVKEIMLTVGFRDESHFVKDFKALFGNSPSQVRRQSNRPVRNSGQ